MTTRSRLFRGSGRRSRPRYTWRFWDTARSTLTSGGSLVFDLGTVGASPDLQAIGIFGDFTVRRLLGKIWAISTRASEANSYDSFAYGVIVATNDAVAVGPTALPTPRNDAADWMAFGEVAVPQTSTGLVASSHPLHTEVIDNKSMRKVNENNQTLVLILSAEGAQDSILVQTQGRMLVSHGQR